MFAKVVAEVEAMTSDDALTALRAEMVVQRRAEARIAALVRKLDSDRAHVADGHASVRGLLRAEFRASDGDITHTLRCGRLIEDLPDVMQALYDGAIGVAQARAFGRARANPRCGDQLVDHAEILLGMPRRSASTTSTCASAAGRCSPTSTAPTTTPRRLMSGATCRSSNTTASATSSALAARSTPQR